jgi:hypothetical protein
MLEKTNSGREVPMVETPGDQRPVSHQVIAQNRNGVDLSKLTEGDWHPVEVEGFLTNAKILHANTAEDKFVVKYEYHFEMYETVVDGDAFQPIVTEVRNPITDDEFAALSEGDRVAVYLRGYEATHSCWVEEVDREAEQISVSGEYGGHSISRTIPRELIYSQS